TFSGSSHAILSGRPVFTPQKPQDRVQILPKIIKVAVPSPQHSPILGQLPDVQIVCNLYLSTNPRNSVYFLPVGNLTLSHFGLPVTGLFVSKTDSIILYYMKSKDTEFLGFCSKIIFKAIFLPLKPSKWNNR